MYYWNLFLAVIVLPCAAAAAESVQPSQELHWPNLEHVLAISDAIFSGGQPSDERSFDTLAEQGIKTIVSVDAYPPDVEAAKARGMRYVHIPIGYDKVPDEAISSAKAVLAACPRPIYFHCHHGVHRGPALAAIALRLDSACPADTALEVLRRAGTSEDCPALWKAVSELEPKTVSIEGITLHEKAPVSGFAAAMAQIDRTWDNLKACRAAGWEVPAAHPDLVPAHEARILASALEDCTPPTAFGADERFLDLLGKSQESSQALVQEFEQPAQREAHFDAIAKSCKDCHKAYR